MEARTVGLKADKRAGLKADRSVAASAAKSAEMLDGSMAASKAAYLGLHWVGC